MHGVVHTLHRVVERHGLLCGDEDERAVHDLHAPAAVLEDVALRVIETAAAAEGELRRLLGRERRGEACVGVGCIGGRGVRGDADAAAGTGGSADCGDAR
jgi:hypothetical protein